MSVSKSKNKPTYAKLKSRVAVLEPIVEALKHHEVDAVIGEKRITFLLLPEVTEALRDSEAGFRAMFESCLLQPSLDPAPFTARCEARWPASLVSPFRLFRIRHL